ncbi:hypothetical protein [Streptomyces sp. TLI_171]|uniref:hypothetical protein n=1 Tax=Streptomyces sp. TLI_171 TaxID=1938859 RepID=UPI000C17E543|nr:hypothetical protein [Streptomyces sp. TLI_171]RKE23509.1 hypothetical protein BX266_6981 [Streptomyces sp. TLI_171]
MESPQRIIRRNWVFWQLLICLVGVAGLLLVYAVVQQNLARTNPGGAPIQLLDVQSATAALLTTGSGLLARGQYATATRPIIGFDGRVIRMSPGSDELVWGCQIRNGAQDAATVWDLRYSVQFAGDAPSAPTPWLEFDALVEELERIGLRTDVDCMVKMWARGAPLAGQERAMIGWFGPRAMSTIHALRVRVQVVDRVGDLHERSHNLFNGARRTPEQATLDW